MYRSFCIERNKLIHTCSNGTGCIYQHWFFLNITWVCGQIELYCRGAECRGAGRHPLRVPESRCHRAVPPPTPPLDSAGSRPARFCPGPPASSQPTSEHQALTAVRHPADALFHWDEVGRPETCAEAVLPRPEPVFRGIRGKTWKVTQAKPFVSLTQCGSIWSILRRPGPSRRAKLESNLALFQVEVRPALSVKA